MKTPTVNIKELEEFKKKNFQERLEFIDKYTQWLKNNPNKKWSAQQKDFID